MHKNTRAHNQINTNTLNTHKHTNTQKHKHTQTIPLQPTECWDMTGFEDSGGWPIQEGLSCFCPQNVNMTLSPLLLANGRQLGSSELVISHCPLCPVKLSTEFCMGCFCGGNEGGERIIYVS